MGISLLMPVALFLWISIEIISQVHFNTKLKLNFIRNGCLKFFILFNVDLVVPVVYNGRYF